MAFALAAMSSAGGKAQRLEVYNDVVTSSAYENSDGEHLGNGYMDKVTVKYEFPISSATDNEGGRILWRGIVRGFYAHLENNGAASSYNPDDMLNANVNVMHVRPLKGRWSLIATAGLCIHTAFHDFTWRDVILNGAAIFSYSHSRRLDYGIGAAITTAYGWPLVLPMPYVRWRNGSPSENVKGTWEIDFNMMGAVQASAATWLTEDMKLNIEAFRMESMAANHKVDGDWKVYSSTTMRSGLRPELKIGKTGMLSLAAGVVWRRGTSLADRSYSGFFKNFNHNRRRHFGPAMYISVGYNAGL